MLDNRNLQTNGQVYWQKRQAELLASYPAIAYICEPRPDFFTLYVSDNVSNLLGYCAQDFIGDTQLWYELLHPDDRVKAREEMQKVFELNKHSFEYRIKHKNGNYIWLRDELILVKDEDNEPIEIYGYALDVTEFKKSQYMQQNFRMRAQQKNQELGDKLQFLWENAPSKIVEISLNAEILISNRTFPELPPQEVIGTNLFTYIPKDFHELIKDLIDEAARTCKVKMYKAPLTVNGKLSWWSNRIVPIKQKDVVTSLVIIGSDITEQQTVRLKKQEVELAHVSRLSTLGEMATGLAHELNQPLAAIINYTRGCVRRLESGNFTEQELIKGMEQAATQAERAAQIIQRVRDFVRKEDWQPKQLDLNVLTKESIDFLESEARQNCVTIDARLTDKQPKIWGDRIQLEQVLVNIIKNAIEAVSSRDKKNIFIETNYLDSKHIEILIRDTGAGFSKHIGERIFDQFFTTKTQGMGMGLPICKTIVEAHGGVLVVHSKEGVGTTFKINLPIELRGYSNE